VPTVGRFASLPLLFLFVIILYRDEIDLLGYNIINIGRGFSSWIKKTTEAFEPNIELVVSRYNEDLEWLKNKKFRYPTTIYNKGTNDNFYKPKGCKVVKLPNVGREGHTYLHHVIDHYDSLPQLTIFLPGSADDKRKIKWVKKVMNKIKTEKKQHFQLKKMVTLKQSFIILNLMIGSQPTN